MTLDDVKKKIYFDNVPPHESWGYPKRSARILISAEVSISPHGHPPMSEIDKILERRVLAALYEDRRREIQEALFEIRVSNPFDGFSWRDKVDKLEKLLAYGPPI